MSKLYFKYGTMNSSKSANLLMIKHNYEEQDKKVLLLKPQIDTRENSLIIKSRIGLQSSCCMLSITERILDLNWSDFDVIIVDESQFLTKEQVDELYQISLEKPVLCFGLLTDFKQELFEGSKRLVELAESLEKIKTICKCGKAANYNARFDENEKLITHGSQVEIGGNEKYKAVCKYCYENYKNEFSE